MVGLETLSAASLTRLLSKEHGHASSFLSRSIYDRTQGRDEQGAGRSLRLESVMSMLSQQRNGGFRGLQMDCCYCQHTETGLTRCLMANPVAGCFDADMTGETTSNEALWSFSGQLLG